MTHSKRHLAAIHLALWVVLALLLSGCSAEPPKGRKASADWSRAVYVGQFVSGSIALTVEGAGERVHVAWPFQTLDTNGITYVQLDQAARPAASYQLRLNSGIPVTPRLLPAGAGRFHLLWISRSPGQPGSNLWHVLLDPEQDLGSAVPSLIVGGSTIGSYDTASDGEGSAFIVYSTRESDLVLALTLDASGQITAGPLEIASGGQSPVVQIDPAGTRHLAWRDDAALIYSSLPPDSLEPVASIPVAQTPVGAGLRLEGPALGLSDGWVYVFWSLQAQSGLEAGTARTDLVAFPVGEPGRPRSESVQLYRQEEQPYGRYQGVLPITQLVQPAPAVLKSEFVYDAAPLAGQQAELGLALVTNQEWRQDVQTQIAVGIFSRGTFEGYQMACKTESLSQSPTLAADSAGHLHLVWREGAASNRAYYASTAPDARARLDRLDRNDLTHAALQGSVEGLAGLAMLPFALIWVVPGLLLLGVVELIWSQEKLSEEVGRTLLGLAIILYQATKLFLFPTITTYVPFSAWVDWPSGLYDVLRVGVPLAIFGLALLAAGWIRKRRSPSNLVFYIAMAASDAVLTLMIYGVNFWATA